MRRISILLGGVFALAASAMAQDNPTEARPAEARPVIVQDGWRPMVAKLDVVRNPQDTGASSPNAPVLDSITVRYGVRTPIGIVYDLVPDFHFHAPGGNALVLHRELVATNGAIAQTQLANASINVPPNGQKNGAVISGGWRCGVPIYYVTMRAVILDAEGNRSNSLTYTIHCNGG